MKKENQNNKKPSSLQTKLQKLDAGTAKKNKEKEKAAAEKKKKKEEKVPLIKFNFNELHIKSFTLLLFEFLLLVLFLFFSINYLLLGNSFFGLNISVDNSISIFFLDLLVIAAFVLAIALSQLAFRTFMKIVKIRVKVNYSTDELKINLQKDLKKKSKNSKAEPEVDDRPAFTFKG